jgi:hypothetical protein
MSERAQTGIGNMALFNRVTPAPTVVCATQGSAFVLVDIDAGYYYTLNETGGYVWRLLATGADITTIVESVAREYSIDTQRSAEDVAKILNSLAELHLVAHVN